MPRTISTLDELRSLVGQEVALSPTLTVSQDMINRFAELTGDHQWIHVDVDRCKRESPFGTTIAHGYLTLSMLTYLVQQAVSITIPCKLTINYGFNRVRFTSPVPAGSRIRARMTLQSLKNVEGALELCWAIQVEVDGKEKPALVAEWLGRRYE